MHVFFGALVGCVVSVALTFVASRVIDRPLTWKDVLASAMAGIVGGAVATATLGVGAASALRTMSAFAAGGATGSASGQLTDNLLHGEPAGKDLVKSTAYGTAIGAATLGVGKAAAPLARAAHRVLPRALAGGSGTGGHGGSPLAGIAAGLDDAVVPVARYVKNALAREPALAAEEAEASGLAAAELPDTGGTPAGAAVSRPSEHRRGAAGLLAVLASDSGTRASQEHASMDGPPPEAHPVAVFPTAAAGEEPAEFLPPRQRRALLDRALGQ
ncbi:MAG: hypothetical protein D6731_13850 [Planctomycetota bacterium]|nr:MAG: hypothetical protein D6731_13850 [Planctomycetota bacterium]